MPQDASSPVIHIMSQIVYYVNLLNIDSFIFVGHNMFKNDVNNLKLI